MYGVWQQWHVASSTSGHYENVPDFECETAQLGQIANSFQLAGARLRSNPNRTERRGRQRRPRLSPSRAALRARFRFRSARNRRRRHRCNKSRRLSVAPLLHGRPEQRFQVQKCSSIVPRRSIHRCERLARRPAAPHDRVDKHRERRPTKYTKRIFTYTGRRHVLILRGGVTGGDRRLPGNTHSPRERTFSHRPVINERISHASRARRDVPTRTAFHDVLAAGGDRRAHFRVMVEPTCAFARSTKMSTRGAVGRDALQRRSKDSPTPSPHFYRSKGGAYVSKILAAR